MSIRCSFAVYNSELCGIYSIFPLENQPVKLVDCNRDIFNHLRTLNLSVGSTERGFKVHHDIMCEADLLCRRVGLFNTNYSLSVCPLHRAKLGIAFKQTKVCTHPLHNGKGRTFRGVNSQQSRKILEDHGVLLPVGSGICYQCYTKITKNISTDQDTSYSDIEPPASLNVQSEVYSFRERKPNSSIFESGLNLDSQLSASTQSDNLSQISTWSDEMDTSLDDINSTIQTISKGSISSLKFQLRTDYEHLKESSKRAVKRKTHTVVLSCIAPGQERKLLKVIQPDESDDQETRYALSEQGT
ncbi:uncharacterized protein LOC127705501 [Mytilus californianus]|uniref:uncharacterized protein LOC127705501 n=1 Tax=Mytilus californianus TaxID=6549 RepID=UPI002245D585|nr:uncharacterized protein LOC127705501 [Mytilus californianus]